MSDSLIPDSPKADAARREMLFVLAATGALCLFMVLMSVGTLPVLGDGSQHFRRATVYYETGFPWHRATQDPAYPSEGFGTVRYYDAGLWHMMLALAWRVVGHRSFLAAQAYQAAFFFSLAVLTYFIGRELYGRRGGLWSWLLIASVPMNLLFGMVFYLEVPVLAFTAAAVYAILRRRPFVMGLALGGMFLTKTPTAMVLAPPLLLADLFLMGPFWPGRPPCTLRAVAAYFLTGSPWRSRVVRTLLAAATCLAIMAPDMAWRYEHFKQPIMVTDTLTAFNLELKYEALPVTQTAIPFNIASLRVDLTMFGGMGVVAALAALGLAVGGLARTIRRFFASCEASGLEATLRGLPDLCEPDLLVAGLPLLAYTSAFLVMLHGAYDARYLQPIVLFASLLVGGLLARLHPFTWHGRWRRPGRWAAAALVASMAVQMIAVPIYVHIKRNLAPETTAAFAWIRENTPPRTSFLYLEANITALTGRPFVWAAAVPHYLFEVPEPEQLRLLYYLGVQYIAIHPTRLCDAVEPGAEPTAYPRPWVKSLEERPYLERVYPAGPQKSLEGQFLIYRVDPTKVPAEWVKDLKLEKENPYRDLVPQAAKPAPTEGQSEK